MSMYEKAKKTAKSNPLIFNSVNLMLATGIASGFGFLFWILVAHTFKTSAIGIATTLLSSSTLISLLGLAGFDTVFVRLLSKSKQRNEQISNGLIISGILTGSLSILFCLSIPFLSPKLAFVTHNPLDILVFVCVSVLTTWNTLTNSILIAYRRPSFVLIINITFSAFKLMLPFLINSKSAIMLFIITGLAQLLNVVLSFAAITRHFSYRPVFKLDFDIVKQNFKFGSVVYLSSVFNLLPDSALPIIVVDKLGSTAAAYFYIAFTIANLLYTVAFSTAQAVLAEASNDEDRFLQHIRRGLRISFTIMLPLILIIILISPYVLALFGHNYSSGSTALVRIMSASGVAVILYSVLGTYFKLNRNLKAILATTASNALVIIVLSLLWAKAYGLNGIGWAWFIGSFVSVGVGILVIKLKPRKTEIN